jgi:hypothetical protein
MPLSHTISLSAGALALAVLLGIAAPSALPTRYERANMETKEDGAAVAANPDGRAKVRHVPLPEAVKAIYMTACVAGTQPFRDEVVAVAEETEINAIIIDIKDYTGSISFPPERESLKPAWDAAKCGATDMKEFIASLHEKGIYVIGRITVFQDPLRSASHPELAVKRASDGGVWKDHKGLSFIDVSAKDHWDYIIGIAEESYAIGFDELNFDYVRFPSDGNMKDIAFEHTGNKDKPEALELFFAYLNKELSDPERYAQHEHTNTGRAAAVPYLSVDLFGMTTTNTDDLSIGQVLERAMPYFDFVAPMVYPSHYPDGFLNLDDPNQHVYTVISHAMGAAVRRAEATTTTVNGFMHERVGTSTPAQYSKPAYDRQKMRPWLQDFDYGGDYGPDEVRAQIQATYDVGLTSWMLWAPSNRYTQTALHAE